LIRRRTIASSVIAMAVLCAAATSVRAQAALLLEEPYGMFGTMNPTGHTAIYLARVCAETPIQLRRCLPGENGAVISRYQGVNGYDWLAIPLIPYLYSVERVSDVPAHVDRESVETMLNRYHEAHLMSLGGKLREGNFVHGGWGQIIGEAYERRIYAFRFATTPEQDDALIAKLNARGNRSHFNLLYNNCADFARMVLDNYFPHRFRRPLFPDIGISTPKQVAYSLERYARKHPSIGLKVMEIPIVPGYQHLRRANNDVSEALFTTGYAIPLAIVNPYLAGGIFLDFLILGHSHLLPKHPQMLSPETLDALTGPLEPPQNRFSARAEAAGAVATEPAEMPGATISGPGAEKIPHE